MSESSELCELVQQTIAVVDHGTKKLSTVIRICIRIARLRNDFVNLLWLQRELIDNSNEFERNRVFSEIKPHFTEQHFDRYNKFFLEVWMRERPAINIKDGRIEEIDMIMAKNVPELENELEGLIDTYNKAQIPTGLHPLDIAKLEEQNFNLRCTTQIYIHHYQKILENIKNRVYDFLSQTEKQLLYGQFHADIFEQNRQYVELRLNQICPEAMKELVAALQRTNERTPEARAQALLSCRRLFKDLADVFYPATSQKLTGTDGKIRDLSEDKYINRLWQFLSEKTQKATSSELLMESLVDLGHRLDKIYDFACKGIHDDVDEFEMNQCLMQTYLLIGDMFRIIDKRSAVGLDSLRV